MFRPDRIESSPWRILATSLTVWRPFPKEFWLGPIEPRAHWRKRALDLCWLGTLGILFIAVAAPTWQVRYSMEVMWLEREVLTVTNLWNLNEMPRLEYVPNRSTSPDAPWLQEYIEDLWGEEVTTSWIDPEQSVNQRYYADLMMDQGRLLEVPWFRPEGDRPSWLWVFCCVFKDIVPSVRLLLDPLMAWLAITVARSLLVRHAPSAKPGAQCLNRACMIPVRWAWIGGLLVCATFLAAPDATRGIRSQAFLPLFALGVSGPVLVSLRPVWTALRTLHPGWGLSFRLFVLVSAFLGVAALVVSVDVAARYSGLYFFEKTGHWLGETSKFSL